MSRYSVLPYMLKTWDVNTRNMRFCASTIAQLRLWQDNARHVLKDLLGYYRLKPCPPRPQVLDKKRHSRYTLWHMTIDTEPGISMPFFMLEPSDVAKPYHPVIASHGHVSNGKVAVAGVAHEESVHRTIAAHNYDYGRQLCRDGFLVFCPDARGFGERKEEFGDEEFLGGSCCAINKMAIPLGLTLAGMWAWDVHRLIDYVHSREDCSVSLLACVGLSGGGYQTLLATALDSRIRCAVISGYFYGFKQSLLEMYYNCSCNYVPHLWEYFDAGDIACMIADRKLMIETGDADELNGREGVKNVLTQLAIVQKAYALAGKEDNLRHMVHGGGHQWFGAGVAEWLRS